MIKQCVSCGKDFEVDETKRNWQSKKLCSHECQRVHSNELKRKEYTPIQWPQKKTCIKCGADFLINEGGNMAQKYCTKECKVVDYDEKRATAVEARRVAKKCDCCGKAFIAGKYAPHTQRHCSHECRMKARHKRQYIDGSNGAKTRNGYKYDFKFIRPVILDRDSHKCVVCGCIERLHVHHWDNSGGTDQVNNDLDNLATMCDICHNWIHNITLVKIDGEWKLDGRIFSILGLTDNLEIKV